MNVMNNLNKNNKMNIKWKEKLNYHKEKIGKNIKH